MPLKCRICNKNILSHSRSLNCAVCQLKCHLSCLSNVSVHDTIYVERVQNDWFCPVCIDDNLPFSCIIDENEYRNALSEFWRSPSSFNISDLNNMVFDPFDLNDDNINDQLCSSDPDFHFYNNLVSNSLGCDYYFEDGFNEKLKTFDYIDKSFSIFHINLRSIKRNYDSLKHYLLLLSIKFSVIAITETWLYDDISSLYQIPDYTFISNHRTHKRGGGVGFYVRNDIEFKCRNDLTFSNPAIESLCIDLNDKLVSVIYRPPNTSIVEFNEYLGKILESIKVDKKGCYLTGDFNINLLNIESHEASSQFLDLMYSSGFFPLITKPTRITEHSATAIDNIFYNNISNISSYNGILVTDLSDHLPIFHVHIANQNKNEDEYIFSRNMKDTNIKRFTEITSTCNWDEVLSCNDPKAAYTIFHRKIFDYYNTCFPVTKIKKGYKTRHPWLTLGLRKSIKIKNRLFFKYKKNFSKYNETKYKIYRNKLNKLLRNAEREHYNNLLTANKLNIKKKWTVIKEVLGRNNSTSLPKYYHINGSLVDNRKTIANGFNKYFSNIGNELAKDIPNVSKDPTSYISACMSNSIYLYPTTESEVVKTINNLKNSSAGWDSIAPHTIKLTAVALCSPLTHLINLSFSSGYFPEEMKITKIIPLFKANDNMYLVNYRPIAVLSVFSKIFEKIMYKRLYNFIRKNNVLYELQFGFLENHSTSMALSVIIDRISKALDDGETSIGVFLDFSKAFDTVDHNILFSKLEKYGIRGLALNWIKSYLSEREQFVMFNGTESDRCINRCGVPQGSILGPLLFLLYINDIANVSSSLYMLLYADDTNVFFTGHDINDLITKVNIELAKVVTWLHANRLSLNVKKSHYMIFSKRNVTSEHAIKIDNKCIDRVDSTKFLGVYIDNKLSWKKHILYTKGKVARSIGILNKARKIFTKDTLLNLYYSFVYPHLGYCIEIWGNANVEYTSALFRLQKKCVRIITNSAWKSHTEPLYKSLDILTLNDLYVYRLYMFMYKFKNNGLPKIFDNFFTCNNIFHQYPTRTQNAFRLPVFKSEIRRKTLRFTAAKLYNQTINVLDYSISIKLFKRSVTSLLKADS